MNSAPRAAPNWTKLGHTTCQISLEQRDRRCFCIESTQVEILQTVEQEFVIGVLLEQGEFIPRILSQSPEILIYKGQDKPYAKERRKANRLFSSPFTLAGSVVLSVLCCRGHNSRRVLQVLNRLMPIFQSRNSILIRTQFVFRDVGVPLVNGVK